MGVEQDRAQREAADFVAHEPPKPESSTRSARERALWRYLGVELKRRLDERRERAEGEKK